MDVAAMKAVSMSHQYTSQEVANTLWAMATLNHYPGQEMLNATALQFAKRLEQSSPQVAVFLPFASLPYITFLAVSKSSMNLPIRHIIFKN